MFPKWQVESETRRCSLIIKELNVHGKPSMPVHSALYPRARKKIQTAQSDRLKATKRGKEEKKKQRRYAYFHCTKLKCVGNEKINIRKDKQVSNVHIFIPLIAISFSPVVPHNTGVARTKKNLICNIQEVNKKRCVRLEPPTPPSKSKKPSHAE